MKRDTGGPRDILKTLLAKRSDLKTGFGGQLDTLQREDNAATEDLAPVFHDQFVALRLNQIETNQLRMVNDAIDRLQHGAYGVCADCEEEILAKRLKAIPWAARCVPCEEAWVDAGQPEEEDSVELAA